MTSGVETQITELRRTLREHAYRYYVLADPTAPDAVYDALYRTLVDLEAARPDLVTPDSPTQRVGHSPVSALATVRHAQHMFSLDNAFSEKDLRDFDRRLHKALGREQGEALPFNIEYKIDGLAAAADYLDGSLVRLSTRGDGETGEVITHNAGAIGGLLRHIDAPGQVRIIGEIFMPLRTFAQLNAELSPEERFSNPRNAAVGAARLMDPAEAASRGLMFLAYGLMSDDAPGAQSLVLPALADLGCMVPPRSMLLRGIDEVCAVIAEGRPEELGFPFDGLVVKLNDLELWDIAGYTGHHPRAAIAFKFQGEFGRTRVIDIIRQVGRTGDVTPVAVLEPVEISGSVIERVTLHNPAVLAEKDVRIGDTVLVKKAGDVIPEIEAVLTHVPGSQSYAFEMTCPVCGHPLALGKTASGKDKKIPRCLNDACPARHREGVEHWGSRDALDIDGLGVETVDALFDAGMVRSPVDLYRLTVPQVASLPGYATKSATQLVAAIDASRQQPLSRVLYGLGIPLVGRTATKAIAARYRTLAAVRAATYDDVLSIEGIGDKIAGALVRGLAERSALLDDLVALEVGTDEVLSTTPAAGVSLEGKTVVITGTLSRERREIEGLLKQYGAKVSGSVSGKTSFVICGENPGSKLAEAQRRGVPILNEDALNAMLAG